MPEVVLRYLLLPPFGTLGETSFRDLTWWTLCLLALSTTEGVSGLHDYQLAGVAGEGMRYSHTLFQCEVRFPSYGFAEIRYDTSLDVLSGRRRRESSGLPEL